MMKLLVVLFAIIAAIVAAPQFQHGYGGFGGGGFSGSEANAGASSQTFNQVCTQHNQLKKAVLK